MSEKNLSKIEELSWVRIIDPYLIPTYLVEQIKERMFTVEKFYKYQEMICTKRENGNLIINPLNLLFVLADKDMVIKGFFWGVVDALANALVINSFSMDKEFWGEGKAVRLLQEKAREIKDGAQLDKVYWVTRCPKHSEKYGFKRSKHQLMEYKDGRNNDGEQCEAGGYRSTDDSATTTIFADDTGTIGGGKQALPFKGCLKAMMKTCFKKGLSTLQCVRTSSKYYLVSNSVLLTQMLDLLLH